MTKLECVAQDVRVLTDPALDPIFARPTMRTVESAWYEHIPFAGWLVQACKPRALVELGTKSEVSYTAFCDAVRRSRLPTQCWSVDPWKGEGHAGHHDEAAYADFCNFHNRHFRSFSTLLRVTSDEARAIFLSGSIDLLHIDGGQEYEHVRYKFESWQPLMSDRAVVLFHEISDLSCGHGVRRLWGELRRQFPSFEFLHGHGLGVLAVGEVVPAPIAALCALAEKTQIATIRERFSLIGERWQSEAEARLIAQQMVAMHEDLSRTNVRAQEFRRASEAAQRDAGVAREEAEAAWARARSIHHEFDTVRHEAAEVRAACERAEVVRRKAEAERDEATARLAAAVGRIAILESRVEQLAADAERVTELSALAERLAAESAGLAEAQRTLLKSTLWRMMDPIRAAGSRIPASFRHRLRSATGALTRPLRRRTAASTAPIRASLTNVPAPDLPVPIMPMLFPSSPPVAVSSAPTAAGTLAEPYRSTPINHVVFVSGEPTTPGHTYRVLRAVAAARQFGEKVNWFGVATAAEHIDEIVGADVVIFWRVTSSNAVDALISAVRGAGGKVIYDIDDLMFRPEFATLDIIDGIRSQGLETAAVIEHFSSSHEFMMAADACSGSTVELARHMREYGKMTFVLPNGFDDATLATSRAAVRRRQADCARDGLVRIGYAAGSRTHQRDFGVAARAIARLLRERPECRLVLFRSTEHELALLDVDEFAELTSRSDQIEWRPHVPLDQLPAELARFDINIAPLEVGNVFCEAKSEIKFFEAALVDVPTVASPTGPFRRAIRDGETGLLAAAEDDWFEGLLRLVDDAALRRRIGHAAFLSVLWSFGPARRAQRLSAMLTQLRGGPDGTRAFALEAALDTAPRSPAPGLPETEPVFLADRMGDSPVSVVVPLYNYAKYVTEALDSVAAQTLSQLDLIVVDDGSTDDSLQVAHTWMQRNAGRFNRAVLLRNARNSGLAYSRNAAIDASETPFVLPLDPDNRLLPLCCERLLEEIRANNGLFAYPQIRCFGAADFVFGIGDFLPMRLAGGNYIDAMALLAKAAWAAAGGYAPIDPPGWEDYDLWCRCSELGLHGVGVPEILAEYRVHSDSMLNTVTHAPGNRLRVTRALERRHAWLSVPYERWFEPTMS